MKTESDTKNKWLATLSLILGTLSFGFAFVSCLPILWGRHTGGQDAILLALGMLALLIMLGGLILGIPGFIVGVIALVRFRKQRDHNRIMRMAVVGILLSSLGGATLFIFLVVPLLLTPT